MSDEYSVDLPYQKRTFISKLNPECPPFEPSSFYHNIQEVSQSKFSSENNNNKLHITPITNGHHDDQNYYSTAIHSIEPSEHVSSETHYIQEMRPDNQHSRISSHIEPVYNDLFNQPLSQTKKDHNNRKKEENTNQISFQQVSNFKTEPILNTTNDEETSNNETEMDTPIYPHEKSDEVKAQRELDEDEIPPAEISADQFSTHIESNTSSTELESNIIDSRPLTELELPYEQHSLNESSSSLPDVVAETLEPTHANSAHQTEPDDVLGNKSLIKQTITPGTLNTRPNRNTLATVSYKLFLIDNFTASSRLIETITNESFFIGEYDILPAIDIVIQLMDCGEHAFIDSDTRHCYGEIGCEEKQIPPVTSTDPYRMKIDLEFHDWKDAPDIQTLSINDRLYWSDKKRHRGNFSYRRKDYSSALQCYRNALKFLDTNQNPLLQEEEEANSQSSILMDRYIQVQNNLAQVYLLNNQYEQCLGAVNDVLKYDSTNIKALFRQAKALFELGNYDQAIQPLKSLLQNQSKDVEKDKVNEMLNICETKLAKYEKNEKEIYKRMFQSKTTVNEKPQIKNIQKIENKNNNNTWWPYVAMGSAVLAAVGLAAIIKYR